MYKQLHEYWNKAHSTQHVLSRFIQSLEKKIGNSDLVGTILMDLSKAYECLPHDLLICIWS